MDQNEHELIMSDIAFTPTERQLNLLYTNLALTQAWLENYDELKDTKYYKNGLKYAMNQAATLVQNHTGRLNELMHVDDENSIMLNQYTGTIEYMIELITTCPPAELMAIAQEVQRARKEVELGV